MPRLTFCPPRGGEEHRTVGRVGARRLYGPIVITLHARPPSGSGTDVEFAPANGYSRVTPSRIRTAISGW